VGRVTLTALVLDVQGGRAESLSDALLEAGALSVTCEAPNPAAAGDEVGPEDLAAWPQVRLTVLCRDEREAERLLRHASEETGFSPLAHELRRVPDEDWVARSRTAFGPIRVSARLWIVPSWHTPPEPDAINLLLDPGLAFGTGSHASTRLCLRWLERHIAGGETVLDYGCGSGILAIAALKLGAARAVGVDIDPDAVAAAAANARRNGVAGEFAESGSPLALSADVVVANILANPLRVLAPIVAERCRPGGRVALSGILGEQAAGVEESYAPWIAFAAPEEEEGWVCLSGTRR
jgi:ribosomal protein L11 methyltransferase